MLLKRKRELAVLGALVRHWHPAHSAYEISELSKISPPRTYEALDLLEKLGLILRHNSKVQINFMHEYSWRFKLLNDMERLMQLPKKAQSAINDIFYVFRNHYGNQLLAAMVIGSAATGQMTESSDIDMLFIVKEKKEMNYRQKDIYRHGSLNLVERSLEEFTTEYVGGDVFTLSALRDGILLADADVLRPFYLKPLPKPDRESVMKKREHMVRIWHRMLRGLKDKDTKRLVELFKQYLVEMTRVELLEKREIPGTRTDIIRRMPPKRRKSYKTVTEKTVNEEVKQYV